MTENKRFIPIFDGFDKRVVGAKDNGRIISFMDMFDLLNKLSEENKELKDLLKSMADRNNEIWLDNGQIIRLKKVFNGEWR